MLIPASCLHAGYPRVVSSSRKKSPTVDGLSAHPTVAFLGPCIPATEVVSGELRRCGKVKTSKSPEHDHQSWTGVSRCAQPLQG